MRTQKHTVLLRLNPDAAFDLVSMPSNIRAWWSASSVIVQPEVGGLWAASWGDPDQPDYISHAIIASFDPPNILAISHYCYYARDEPANGMPSEEPGCIFRISDDVGGSKLVIEQSGFQDRPEGEDFYQACYQGWREVLAAISARAEVLASDQSNSS